METTVAKWGNSLGVRLPKAVVEEAELASGDRVEIKFGPRGKIVLTPKRKRLNLDDLLRGMSAKTRHGEQSWGAARGAEAW